MLIITLIISIIIIAHVIVKWMIQDNHKIIYLTLLSNLLLLWSVSKELTLDMHSKHYILIHNSINTTIKTTIIVIVIIRTIIIITIIVIIVIVIDLDHMVMHK